MKVGVGLPTMLHGIEPELVLDWAKLADAGPFSTVSTGELITTPSYDALSALTAVGAVTKRIRLMTNVLVLPLHRAGLLAKQTATISVLTRGRLTLGIGIGGKKPILFGITKDQSAHSNYPDFEAAPAPYEGRADRFADEIGFMRRIWAGESPLAGVPPLGPPLGSGEEPEILIGGFDQKAIARAATLANGITIFDHGADETKVGGSFDLARAAWKAQGRTDEPRLVASTYFALGPDSLEGKQRFLDSHYAHLSTQGREKIGEVIVTTDEGAVRSALSRFESIGADEVVLVPIMPSLDQVERLGALVDA